MPHSTFSTITHIFGLFTFCFSIWATISLFVLIEKRSRKEIGSYKNFLRIYCLYAFSFAMIDWLVQPALGIDVHGFGYAFYSENRLFDLGYSGAHLMQILYCGCFIASSSFLSLNFIYRYVSTFRKSALKYFNGWGLLIWFCYCTLPFLIWSLCVFQWMSPTPEITRHLNNTTMLFEDFDLTDRAYVAVLCRYAKDTPDFDYGDVNWQTLSALLGLCVFQAIVPLISVYIPAGVIIIGSMTGVYVGQIFSYLTIICISFYPPLDTTVFLLSIRDYREALFCVRGSSGSNSFHPVGAGTDRPGTAKVSDVSIRRLELAES